MATPFSRTLRSLAADRPRRSAVSLALGVALLAGWLAWMFVARVAVYVTSPEARVEIDKVAHPIQAPLSGRVVAVSMELGKQVHAGDVLVELDVEAQRLEVDR